MTSNPAVRIGVLGAAAIARRSVIPAIVSLPDLFVLSGIASRDAQRLSSSCETFGCHGYGSYEELLDDPHMQAVYIPLPNALHHTYVTAALERGKHVLVEKSLGCSLREVDEITLVAERQNLVVLENFQFRFHSQLRTILGVVREGVIGDLRSVRISFGFPPFADGTNIRYQAALGGGALLDVGAYPLKLAPYFLGEQLSVGHASMAYDTQRGVDIWGGGVLQQHGSALQCQFAYGFDHSYQCALELWGSKGKLRAGRIFTAPAALSPVLELEIADAKEDRLLPPDDHFKNMLSYFCRLVRGEESASVEHEGNLRQAALLEDVRRCASVSPSAYSTC